MVRPLSNGAPHTDGVVAHVAGNDQYAMFLCSLHWMVNMHRHDDRELQSLT